MNRDGQSSFNIVLILSGQQEHLPEDYIVCSPNGRLELSFLQIGAASQDVLDFLQLYLPCCLLPLWARQEKRAITIAHFAQSLDGKIATTTGDSKWIGNTENLVHAHRMRALCDAVLIGTGTLLADKPRLTVRHVTGQNPVRVVLGATCSDFESLYNSSSGRILVISSEADRLNGKADYIQLKKQNGRISALAILKTLYQKNIKMVYLEGGPTTTSYFLEDQSVDILQLHLAPVIFGSGKAAFSLPSITTVDEAVHIQHYCYQPVGNAIMFMGQLNS